MSEYSHVWKLYIYNRVFSNHRPPHAPGSRRNDQCSERQSYYLLILFNEPPPPPPPPPPRPRPSSITSYTCPYTPVYYVNNSKTNHSLTPFVRDDRERSGYHAHTNIPVNDYGCHSHLYEGDDGRPFSTTLELDRHRH